MMRQRLPALAFIVIIGLNYDLAGSDALLGPEYSEKKASNREH